MDITYYWTIGRGHYDVDIMDGTLRFGHYSIQSNKESFCECKTFFNENTTFCQFKHRVSNDIEESENQTYFRFKILTFLLNEQSESS